jgi:hypothetical protein
MKESKPDITGSPWDVQLEIGNVTDDLGTTLADIQQRQQINELYSAGATNIMNFGYQDNCDQNIPALIPFYLDDDVVNINTAELTFRTKKFRAYSRATEGGGATVATSSSGGGTSSTTSSGGGYVQTSAENGNHFHRLFVGTGGTPGTYQKKEYYAYFKDDSVADLVNIEANRASDIYTFEETGSHTHPVSIPSTVILLPC